jgi:hypothetical protein
MAGKVRLNKVIKLLEHGQAVFSCGTVPNGNFDKMATIGQSAYDLIIIETEHVGFDFLTLRHSLQYLLNRQRIAEKGSLQPDVVPLVRIPPYTRERNEWVIKRWHTITRRLRRSTTGMHHTGAAIWAPGSGNQSWWKKPSTTSC